MLALATTLGLLLVVSPSALARSDPRPGAYIVRGVGDDGYVVSPEGEPVQDVPRSAKPHRVGADVDGLAPAAIFLRI